MGVVARPFSSRRPAGKRRRGRPADTTDGAERRFQAPAHVLVHSSDQSLDRHLDTRTTRWSRKVRSCLQSSLYAPRARQCRFALLAPPPPPLLRHARAPLFNSLAPPRQPIQRTGKKSRRGGTLDEIAEQLKLASKDAANADDTGGGWKFGVSAMDGDGDGDDDKGAGGASTSAAAAAAAPLDMEMADAVAAALKSRNKAGAKRKQQKRQSRLLIGGALGARVQAAGAGGGGGGGAAMDTREAMTMTWPTRAGGVGKRTGKRGKRTSKQARRAARLQERGTAHAERRVMRHVATVSKKAARGVAKTLY